LCHISDTDNVEVYGSFLVSTGETNESRLFVRRILEVRSKKGLFLISLKSLSFLNQILSLDRSIIGCPVEL
jgi:hypothetical protein